MLLVVSQALPASRERDMRVVVQFFQFGQHRLEWAKVLSWGATAPLNMIHGVVTHDTLARRAPMYMLALDE